MPRHSSGTLQTAINESIDSSGQPHSIAATKPDQAPMRRSWIGQLAEMLRKSALIKKRRRRATLGELGYPVYFILILWVIKSSLPPGVDYPAVKFTSAVPVEQPGALTCRWDAPGHGQSVPGCDGTNGNATGNNGTWGGSILLGFVNTSAAGEALATKAVAALGHHASAIGFTSIAAMESHARELQAKDTPTLESKLFYGVEFSDDMLSYTLRFMPQPPGVGVPASVAGTVLDATECRPYWKHFDRQDRSSAQGYGAYGDGDSDLDSVLPTKCKSLDYLTDGFLDLQIALDRAVLQSKLGETTQLNVKVQPLPRTEFLTNFASRSTALRSIFSIYLVIPLTSPVRWMTTFLVEEKETKIKEGMLMMGLHYSVFWTCWGITYAVVHGIISLVVTAAIHFTGMLVQSSPVVVYLLLWSYGVSTIPYCFAMSTFISNQRTGGPLASMLVNLFALPFVYVVAVHGTADALSEVELWLSSLVSPLAFCLGMDAVWTFDAGFAGFEGMNLATIHIPGPLGFSLLDSLKMLWLDALWLSLLALYLDSVVPQEFGSQLPANFLCTSRWWTHRYHQWFSRDPNSALCELSGSMLESADDYDCAREAVGEEIESTNAIVKLHRVTKIFRKQWLRESDDDTLAVDRVNLNLVKGEIFSLLGHNGAGKTTLMGILTGLHEPTSGSATINGFDVQKDMTTIRQALGVCPQHDILFDDLTVFEHIRLFASIKGVAQSQIQEQAEIWLTKLGLLEKLNAMANTLSGGQKRRLSVALAMIGDPAVVILDEPTTGLDPGARREVWVCLKESRRDRLIILSTHFMDEADLLADRKAIIAHGKLRCVGSSLFLKSHFGLGYSLELTKSNSSTPVEPIQELIAQYVPNARLAAQTMATIEFTLPLDAVSQFAGLLAKLESELVTLRCKSYGINAGSLVSVFMRFADGGDLAGAATSALSGRPAELEPTYVDIEGPLTAQQAAVPNALGQLKAMIHAKYAITKKNKRAFSSAILLPLILIFLSSRVGTPGKLTLPQDQSLTFVPDALSGSFKNTLPIALSQTAQEFSLVQKWLQESTGLQVVCYDGSATCSHASGQQIATSFLNNNGNRQNWRAVVLFEHTDVHHVNAESNWQYTIMPNLLEVQVLPTMTNLINSAILKSDVNTQNLDLKTTSRSYAAKPSDTLPFHSGGLFMAIALAAPATTFVAFAVRDKELRTRHQLSVMGLPSSVYWLGLFLHDSCLYSVAALGSVVIMVLMGTEPMGGRALGPYTVLICLFVPTMVLFSYILSFLFKRHVSVYQTVPLLLQLTSIGAFLASSVLLALPNTRATAVMVNKICMFFLPHYTVIGASTFMQQQYLEDKLRGHERSYWGNDQVQQALAAYATMIPVFFAAVVALDRHKTCSRPSVDIANSPADSAEVDADVLAEAARASDQSSSYAIRARNLHKAYQVAEKDKSKGKKLLMAVKDLSLTVSEGECLGLLGPNGAGKTTTVRMLTAEESVGGGEAFVNGFNVATQVQNCWQSLGFCPQHDALWPELTTRQHLQLYAAVKSRPPGTATRMLQLLDLVDHAEKMSSDLSGGNRRKLSAAIALVAQPKVLFLDEPSSGMDVATRQHMWQVILSSLQHSCVVLTTHSMEEADALSTRVAIMINGKIRCIGSSQELKAKYGQGYQLELQLRSTATVETVVRFIKERWFGELTESFGSRLLFALSPATPREPIIASRLFAEVETNREKWGLVEYAVSQPSLEQIFLKFAQGQRLEEE